MNTGVKRVNEKKLCDVISHHITSLFTVIGGVQMNKGKVVGFRVSDDLYKILMQKAEVAGCTISDVGRNIMTEHVRVEDLLHALQETRKSHTREIAQLRDEMKTLTASIATTNHGSVNNGSIEEIRRIVTLIGQAMPFVARNL